MANRIQIRRDTAANWLAVNPILAQGELGYELSTGKLKVGNGTSNWAALAYFNDGQDFSGAYADLTGAPTTLSAFINDTGFITSTNSLINGPLNVTLDTQGTLNTPLLLPKTFTAILDSAHMVNAIALTDAPWQLGVQFQVSPTGSVQTLIDNPVHPSNPGYVAGQQFEYTEVDHGISGLVFTVTLVDIQNPGPMVYTANIAVSQPPAYPATVRSLGAIKLTADATSWVFGTDGKLALPTGGDIVDSTGVSVLGGGANTGTIQFRNNSMADLTGINITNADQVTPETASVIIPANVPGSAVSVNNNNNIWSFQSDGTLSLPGDILTSTSIRQNNTWTRSTFPTLATNSEVIWSGVVDYISSAKLTIQLEANELGDATGWHSQVCEAIIASRGYANSFGGPGGDPVMTVYAVTYTSTVPLVTFTVQRNAITKVVEVVATKTAAIDGNANFRIHSVEMSTRD